MTPDEVRMLDNNLALLFIRGERPLVDEKYDLLKHPNIRYTTDGNARPYEHGGKQYVVASMSFVENPFEFEQSNFEMALKFYLMRRYKPFSKSQRRNYIMNIFRKKPNKETHSLKLGQKGKRHLRYMQQ